MKEFITNKKGELKKIRTVKVKFENRRMIEVPGTEQELSCQLLLIAAGFIGCEPATADAFGIPLGKRGTIETEADHYRTPSVHGGRLSQRPVSGRLGNHRRTCLRTRGRRVSHGIHNAQRVLRKGHFTIEIIAYNGIQSFHTYS